MRSRVERAFFLALALGLVALAFAAEIVPDTRSPTAPRPISSIIAERGEGDDVLVLGRVREKTGPSSYVIADSSGLITVQIPDALLTGGITLAPGTPVQVHGRIAFTPGRTVEVEAHRVAIVRAGETALGAGDVQIR